MYRSLKVTWAIFLSLELQRTAWTAWTASLSPTTPMLWRNLGVAMLRRWCRQWACLGCCNADLQQSGALQQVEGSGCLPAQLARLPPLEMQERPAAMLETLQIFGAWSTSGTWMLYTQFYGDSGRCSCFCAVAVPLSWQVMEGRRWGSAVVLARWFCAAASCQMMEGRECLRPNMQKQRYWPPEWWVWPEFYRATARVWPVRKRKILVHSFFNFLKIYGQPREKTHRMT